MDRYQQLAAEFRIRAARQPIAIHQREGAVVEEVEPVHKSNSAQQTALASSQDPRSHVFQHESLRR